MKNIRLVQWGNDIQVLDEPSAVAGFGGQRFLALQYEEAAETSRGTG